MAIALAPIYGVSPQFFDNNGQPLANGQLFITQSGSSKPETSWANQGATVVNPNPITLNSAGYIPGQIWIDTNKLYRFQLVSADGVVIRTDEGLQSVIVNTGGGPVSGEQRYGYRTYSTPFQQVGNNNPAKLAYRTDNAAALSGYVGQTPLRMEGNSSVSTGPSPRANLALYNQGWNELHAYVEVPLGTISVALPNFFTSRSIWDYKVFNVFDPGTTYQNMVAMTPMGAYGASSIDWVEYSTTYLLDNQMFEQDGTLYMTMSSISYLDRTLYIRQTGCSLKRTNL